MQNRATGDKITSVIGIVIGALTALVPQVVPPEWNEAALQIVGATGAIALVFGAGDKSKSG